jgi:hypothetical protein
MSQATRQVEDLSPAGREWIDSEVRPNWGLEHHRHLVRLFGYRREEVERVAKQDRRAAVILHTARLAEDEEIRAYPDLREGDDEDKEASPDAPPPPVVTDPSLEPAWLKREFHAILKAQCARAEELLAAHEAEPEDDDLTELADQAAFDDSVEGERLHRYQNHWSRSLLRTLDAIGSLREQEDPDVMAAEPESDADDCGTRRLSARSSDQSMARLVPARRDCPTGNGRGPGCSD